MPDDEMSFDEAMLVVIFMKLNAIEQKLKDVCHIAPFKLMKMSFAMSASEVIKNISSISKKLDELAQLPLNDDFYGEL